MAPRSTSGTRASGFKGRKHQLSVSLLTYMHNPSPPSTSYMMGEKSKRKTKNEEGGASFGPPCVIMSCFALSCPVSVLGCPSWRFALSCVALWSRSGAERKRGVWSGGSDVFLRPLPPPLFPSSFSLHHALAAQPWPRSLCNDLDVDLRIASLKRGGTADGRRHTVLRSRAKTQ